MTEENTYLDRRGRKNCRKCAQDRKRRSRQGVKQHVAHHKAVTFTKRTAMDEALEQQPPVITWEKGPYGVWHAVEVIDPHAEAPYNPVRHQAQIEAYARKRRDAA